MRRKYDLSSDGGIGFDDFEIFARSFGNSGEPRAGVHLDAGDAFHRLRTLRRVRPSALPSPPPMRMAIPSRTACVARMRTVLPLARARGRYGRQGTYDFEAQSSYSVILRVSDGEGGRASLVVGIAVTDVDEPPAAPPSGVVVTPGDSALTVRWDAAPDEAGKPPVSGYEVAHRARG